MERDDVDGEQSTATPAEALRWEAAYWPDRPSRIFTGTVRRKLFGAAGVGDDPGSRALQAEADQWPLHGSTVRSLVRASMLDHAAVYEGGEPPHGPDCQPCVLALSWLAVRPEK